MDNKYAVANIIIFFHLFT